MVAARPFTIVIDGEMISGWVRKDGGTYKAYAEFRRRTIEGAGRSESGAIEAFRQVANYEANR